MYISSIQYFNSKPMKKNDLQQLLNNQFKDCFDSEDGVAEHLL